MVLAPLLVVLLELLREAVASEVLVREAVAVQLVALLPLLVTAAPLLGVELVELVAAVRGVSKGI